MISTSCTKSEAVNTTIFITKTSLVFIQNCKLLFIILTNTFNNFEKYLHLNFKQKGPVDIPYNLSLVYSTSCEDETTQQTCYFIFEQHNLPPS